MVRDKKCNLSLTRLVKDILSIAKQRTWAVVNYAAKHRLQMHTTGMLWRSQAYNAFKHLLVFCPLETKILIKLSKAQETRARALLGGNRVFLA